jgi:hypothetical protein
MKKRTVATVFAIWVLVAGTWAVPAYAEHACDKYEDKRITMSGRVATVQSDAIYLLETDPECGHIKIYIKSTDHSCRVDDRIRVTGYLTLPLSKGASYFLHGKEFEDPPEMSCAHR